MYYSSIGILSLILLLINNADSLFVKRGAVVNTARSKYRLFLFAAVLYYMADSMWGILIDIGIVPLAYFDTVLFFVSMGLCVLFWVRSIAVFLNQNRFWTNALTAVGATIFGAEVTVIIINFFIPIMFSFDENGNYIASPARYIILYVQLILFVVVSLDALVASARFKGNDKFHHLAIGTSGMVMALFVFFQAQFPLMPFYSVGILIATSIVHSFVVVEERVKTSQKIGSIMTVAYKDPLTNVRNAIAYTEYKEMIDGKIRENAIKEFAVVVFDLNDLKKINDTEGHDAGDKYIKDGCSLICHTFEHSPVFRIGGDEFVAFLMNNDYKNRDRLFAEFNRIIDDNTAAGKVIIAAGISLFDAGKDKNYDDVFVRADDLMYERKKELKERK